MGYNLLAYVTIIVGSTQWTTIEPEVCVDTIAEFEAALGEGTADYRCDYTFAVVKSLRPQRRPE